MRLALLARRAHILMMFVEESRRGALDDGHHGYYAAPFRDLLPDGNLGPEWGPGDWAGAHKKYRAEAREAGALWETYPTLADFIEANKYRLRDPKYNAFLAMARGARASAAAVVAGVDVETMTTWFRWLRDQWLTS